MMIASPQLTSTTTKMTNHYLQKIGNSIGAHAILETCDHTRIMHKGYESIFKKFKTMTSSTRKGLKVGCLSKPHSIRKLRQDMNNKLADIIGDYYSINCSFEILLNKKSKALKRITLNEHNTFFCDIEAIQRTMVSLYQITLEGTTID